MTDASLAAGELSSAENLSNDINLLPHDGVDAIDATEAAAPVIEDIPNGFVTLGLAPELIAAVKDLGFTQPTTVQLKTIPLAMQGVPTEGKAAKFVDLMVSSQTGSGKTAAFLLPVLHTLLKQQEQIEIDARADYERAVAEAAEKGEAPPKRAKRKRPDRTRVISRAPTPGALTCLPNPRTGTASGPRRD